MISIIAAVAKKNVIGYKNALPWGNIPKDMEHFKNTTIGKPVIMGFNTFKSIGKPLKGRVNIILAKDQAVKDQNDCIFVSSPEEALKEAEKSGQDEIMIIGGASVYKLFFKNADRMYLTFIDADFEGDTYFPEVKNSEWRETEKSFYKAGEKSRYDLEFITYDRIK
ncbi:dihydrofolate reductase [Candidatus Azambacteria bacterium]|nr:dihydrofolate reductase [Candidatus Azambacteria bacterium]